MNSKKEGINQTSIIIGFAMLCLGTLLAFLDSYKFKTPQNLLVSIGCSLIASAIIIIANAIFLERKIINPLDKWGIKAIYNIRADINPEISRKLPHLDKQLDIVAFGLKSLRDTQDDAIDELLHKGVNIRILTMHPESPYVTQREIEEKEAEGQIKSTIEKLIKWAEEKNHDPKHRGHIEIKVYHCITLDFYWRMDKDLYVGPYWYNRGSQQTITYQFTKGQDGFKTYSNYFDKLWSDSSMTTLVSKKRKKTNKS